MTSLDLFDRVVLRRAIGGVPAGTEGSVADAWCEGRYLVEVPTHDGRLIVVEALVEDLARPAPPEAP